MSSAKPVNKKVKSPSHEPGETKGFIARLPVETHLRLRRAALEHGTSANALVNRAVEDFLQKLDK